MDNSFTRIKSQFESTVRREVLLPPPPLLFYVCISCSPLLAIICIYLFIILSMFLYENTNKYNCIFSLFICSLTKKKKKKSVHSVFRIGIPEVVVEFAIPSHPCLGSPEITHRGPDLQTA